MDTFLGSVGVGLLLLAYALNTLGWLDRERQVYASMNLVGAGLACWASWRIDYLPFVVLEGAWAVVAAVALIRSATPLGRPRT